MTSRAPDDEVPGTFRRIVIGILVVATIAGWAAGATPPGGGLALLIIAPVLAASFFGRVGAIPGAAAVGVALHAHPPAAVALAGMVLVVGERTQHLRGRLGKFAHRSFTDRLTGLFNYDFLQAQVRYEVDRVRRYGSSCSLIVLDLDNFKNFNDTYGHQAGNLLLRAVADAIRREKRDSDFAARFGGEELVVLVPGEAQDAMKLAERMREAVGQLRLPHLGPDGRVTASLGVASFPEQAGNAAELFERADQALYVAKETGKDRVIVYPNVKVRRRSAVVA